MIASSLTRKFGGKGSTKELLQDPYTRACASATSYFSDVIMAHVMSAPAGFPEPVQELYSLNAVDLERSLANYKAYARLIPAALEGLRQDPHYGENVEEIARLENTLKDFLAFLSFHHDEMNWRKFFVQRHFTALLGDVGIVVTGEDFPQRAAIRGFIVSLGELRDEIFVSPTITLIEEYLELSRSIRAQDSYMLRRIQVERDEQRSVVEISTIEALEDELLVRALLEDATHC